MKTLKKLFYCLLMLGLLLAISSAALAQTAEKKSLTLDGAERVITAAKAEAAKVKAPGGVIAVVDAGGNFMALERLDGTFAAGANISIDKRAQPSSFKSPLRFSRTSSTKAVPPWPRCPTRSLRRCKAESQLYSMDRSLEVLA
jgi:hypothetical protein